MLPLYTCSQSFMAFQGCACVLCDSQRVLRCAGVEMLHRLSRARGRADAAAAQPGREGWAPPEALQAAAATSGTHASWRCAMCEMLNAPDADKCEGCSTHKMVTDAHRAEERRAAERGSAARGGRRRGKGTKMAWNDLHSPAKAAGAWDR